MDRQTLLQLKNASVDYGGVRALKDVTLNVHRGEVVAVMGPNGAGKSTVLKAMFGLALMSQGTAWWQGKRYQPIPHEVVHKGLAFVPQGRRVFRKLSVRENLEIGGWIIGSKQERLARMEEVLDFFPGLKPKLHAASGSLSGGQQQMLALARGLMINPKLLLLDEPSLGLAPKIVKEVFAKVREINRQREMAVVVVEHNIKSLLDIVDRAYVLDKGEVVANGGGKEIIDSDILEQVFLGTYKR